MVPPLRRSAWLYLAGALLITGVGFAIRAHHLAGDSLWIDEMLTERTAGASLSAIFSRRDHPPLLYLLSRLSLQIFGDGAFALRMPSLFAGVLALPLLYRLGKEIGRPGAGLWSALLLALTPFHVRHAQEARHYALLLTLTVATYLLLYRGLRRPSWRAWFLFAMLTGLNLYTHYAALIVLLSQSVLIGLWLGYQLWRGRYRLAGYVAGTATLVTLLYLPWLPRLLTALGANVGPESVSGQGRQVANSIDLWFRVALAAFTPASELLRYLLPTLFLGGVVCLVWQKQWLALALSASGLLLPLLLLYLFPISREPYPRYVIYTLPFYLLPVGVAISAGLQEVAQGRQAAEVAVSGVLAAGLFLVYLPLLQAEYAFVLNDWTGVQTYLRRMTEEGDVLLGVSLEFPTGYNHVTASLPYFLDQEERQYLLISGNDVGLTTAETIANSQGDVWAIFTSGGRPVDFANPAIKVVPFQTDIYLAHEQEAPADTLAATVDLYQALIPLAMAPAPQCYLRLDLAALYATQGQYDAAATALQEATAQCPGRIAEERERPLQCVTARGVLAQEVAAGKEEAARPSARALLTCDRKDPMALEVLTARNLLASFQAGEAMVNAHNSPEPVKVRTFTMPNNGDQGEVLFTHPPAGVSFGLTLPEHPVSLQTRIALAPESWGWGGDGATFVVEVAPEAGPADVLYREDVTNDAAGQGWHEVNLPLAKYAGQTVTLTLRTEAGTAGDATGDWAGWETPRLLWEPTE